MVISSLTAFLLTFAIFILSLIIFNYSRIVDERLSKWLIACEQEDRNPTETDNKRLKHDNIKAFVCMWGGFAGVVISLLSMLTVIIIIALAEAHGLPKDELNSTSFTSVLAGIANSPIESSVEPENIKSGDIIIYYRFGCKDCEAVYKDLKNSLADVSDVYWISTRSKTGETLLKTYPVTEVPSGVYVRKTGNTSFNKFLLYIIDDDNISLNNDSDYGLPRLLYLKDNDL